MGKPRRPRVRHGPAVSPEAAVQLHAAGKLAEAEAAYRKLLARDRNNARLHHLLGRLLHQRGRSEEGVERLRAALSLCPDDAPSLNDLGLVYKETGAFGEALKCFQRLTKLQPTNAAALSNLGNVLKTAGDLSGAETAYRDALANDPAMLDVYPNLAAVLRRLDRLDDASEVFEQWLEHEPGNPVALHLRDAGRAAEGAAPPRASEAYVRDVFDEFAETFDQDLATLAYHGPQLIDETLPERADLHVLDAGCGTGLCGEILRPVAQRLVGVDLSPKMLAKAKLLSCYDELVERDLVEYLNASDSQFDLIVLTDTFGYFGELEPVVAAIVRALKPGGQVLGTFETLAADGGAPAEFQLTKSGRYKHATSYLERVLRDHGLATEIAKPSTLREEAGDPVAGVVMLAGVGSG